MKEYDLEFMEQFFYAPSQFDKQGGLWPLRAGRNIAKASYRSKPRFIEYYSFHFILEGQLFLRYNSQEIVLKKGDVFCLFPQITYQYGIIPSDSQLRMYWSAIDGPQVAALMKLAGITESKPYAHQVVTPGVERILQQFIHEFKHVREYISYPILVGFILQLINSLISLNNEAILKPIQSGWVQKSLDFIHAHFTERITVGDIANYAGVHRSHLSETFSRQIGLSPLQYIQKLRMNKGEDLLKETDNSITDIALSLGYPDIYSFSKAFTKYYGVSPSKYKF